MYVFMAHANLVGSEKDVDNAKGAQKEHNYRMSHFAEFMRLFSLSVTNALILKG